MDEDIKQRVEIFLFYIMRKFTQNMMLSSTTPKDNYP